MGIKLDADRNPQTYGIGINDPWEVGLSKAQPGLGVHTADWPMDNSTHGGGFLYHLAGNKVTAGFVVGLDYRNSRLQTTFSLGGANISSIALRMR